MADEASALVTVAPAPLSPEDYEAIRAAVMTTARGRWFLEEYARRSRHADTQALLAAIERIEAVIRGEHIQEQSRRIELLELARTIAQTRAEVAEAKPDDGAQSGRSNGAAPPNEVYAAAERLQEIVWAMREQGIDPANADQIAELAATILSASSLRNPADHRAQKLAEVLRALEARIEAMLKPTADEDGETPAAENSAPPSAGSPHASIEQKPSANAAMEIGPGIGDAAKSPSTTESISLPEHEAPSEEFLLHPLSVSRPVSAVDSDPLAAVDALSEAERIALFT
jgi:hypothetical protein